MTNAQVRSPFPNPRLAKRPSISIASTTCRVSRAQSLRLRAYDLKVEAAAAKKAKAAEAKQAKADKKSEII